ncbi:AMP-binding protein [Psychrobacter sp. ASPA161_9]|uniref:AMP-binding protein n=1 Tax=Psychrobacter sp. ASPA161_9 TaxID=3160961 RepID=UPI003F817AE3
MINGMMMHCNLNITSIMQHALALYSEQKIMTLKSDGITTHEYTYEDAFARVAQFANSLDRLHVSKGATIGTIAWNNYQHFELHYAIPCSERIYHTINPKLPHEQLLQIIISAQNEVIIVEQDCLHIIEDLYEHIQPFLKYLIVLGDVDTTLESPLEFMFYEELLAIESTDYDWPDIPEQTASGLCYTSGTTGAPKGVLYSHRSTVLHALTLSMANVVGLDENSCIMPLVPLYHISAWGMPFNAVLCGSKIVWPHSFAGKIEKVYNLIQTQAVDVSMAVPTIWTALKNHLQENNITETTLKRAISGGSAASYSLIESLSRYGIALENAWGMTETSSMGACNRIDNLKSLPKTQILKCGRPIFGMQMRLKGKNNELLPHNGISEGLLEIRGHNVAKSYHNNNSGNQTTDNTTNNTKVWFDTGDIATIDVRGYMNITDRAKDMIKTGGEWVSSVEIENAMLGHEKVAEAAVIAANHPKWGERPLLILVTKPTTHIEHVEIETYLAHKLHKWSIPSATILINEMPYTGTGKISKKTLREKYYDYFMED